MARFKAEVTRETTTAGANDVGVHAETLQDGQVRRVRTLGFLVAVDLRYRGSVQRSERPVTLVPGDQFGKGDSDVLQLLRGRIVREQFGRLIAQHHRAGRL